MIWRVSRAVGLAIDSESAQVTGSRAAAAHVARLPEVLVERETDVVQGGPVVVVVIDAQAVGTNRDRISKVVSLNLNQAWIIGGDRACIHERRPLNAIRGRVEELCGGKTNTAIWIEIHWGVVGTVPDWHNPIRVSFFVKDPYHTSLID